MKKIVISLFFISFNLFAHGENKPGPHGGKIKMPGTFHTEFILNNSQNSFKVYLLDMNFKNPVIKNSYVHYSISPDKKVICEPKKNFFICEVNKLLKNDMLVKIYAKRFKAKGTTSYRNFLNEKKIKMSLKMRSKIHHH